MALTRAGGDSRMSHNGRAPIFTGLQRSRNMAALALTGATEALTRAITFARQDGREAPALEAALEYVHNAREALR